MLRDYSFCLGGVRASQAVRARPMLAGTPVGTGDTTDPITGPMDTQPIMVAPGHMVRLLGWLPALLRLWGVLLRISGCRLRVGIPRVFLLLVVARGETDGVRPWMCRKTLPAVLA